MAVYMIQGESRFGPVKIGHSADPDVRLPQLQVGSWEELRVIRLFDGGELEEALLHARFSDLYIRGEWHSFSRTMLGDVGLVEIPLRRAVSSPVTRPASHTDIVARIDEFLFHEGMSPSTFGIRAVNDGKLVGRLRSGTNVQTSTIDRALAFIASQRRRPQPDAAA